MKVCVFIVLMVLQAITCEKAVSKLRRKLIVPKMNEKCKKIKCAAVDEPLCVRMRRQDLSLTIHIIAANKCELEYMKCHDDVEAKTVPMKYCSHSVGETDGKKKNKPDKSHVRVKRDTMSTVKDFIDKYMQGENETGFKDNNKKTKHHKLKKLRINNKKISQWKKEKSNVIPKGNENRSAMKKGSAAGRQKAQAMNYHLSSETDTEMEYNEGRKIEKGVAGHLVNVKEEDLYSSMQELQLQPKAFILPSMEGKSYLSQDREEALNFWGSEELGPEFPMLSNEAVNFSKEELTQADMKEYVALCPTACLSRDIMVCGRCQHGVYKTFLSVCHLRMFTCNHEEEILQLVSRYPCVLSAPYISDSNGKPKASIQEFGDDDKILRFIICRSKGQLGTDEKPPGDPRCSFPATKEKLKHYDFRGVDVQLETHLIQHADTLEY